MGLCIFSGPKWEEDSLNRIDYELVYRNAVKMRKEKWGPFGYKIEKEESLSCPKSKNL